MGGSVNFPPSEDGSAATVTVAELIAGLVLPSIASLATDTAGLAELPPLPGRRNTNPDAGTNPDSDSDSDSDCGGGSQLEAVQWLLDGCTDAVAALRAHQNRCAGLAVVLIERCEAVAALESGLLSLDRWQREQSMAGLRAELALLLRLPEGATERLMAHSTALVRELPATMEALSSGVLGWEFAVIIAEETTALREAGLGQELLDSYEHALLGKAAQGTINGFKDKARRLRERSHPETLTARTRRAYTDRQLRVSRARDGMSWLSIYAPAPTIEGIWDQCTLTAQAAQGPHEQRTLTQLRADVAAALLLNQSMAHNNIHTPPNTYTPASSHAPASSTTTPAGTNTNTSTGSYSGNSAGTRHQPGPVPTYAPEPMQNPGPVTSPDPARDPGPDPDPGRSWYELAEEVVPVFDDPDYENPFFKDPDHRNDLQELPTATPPLLTPPPPPSPLPPSPLSASPPSASSPSASSQASGTSVPSSAAGAGAGGAGAAGAGVGVVWPPLPKVLPVVLIPALALLGATNEPAWMEGAGPMSIEVARRLMGEASCFYRVLTDPLTNTPLDAAPQQYRLTQAMRVMLRIRDEYCQFPGCLSKAISCQADHIKAFEHGGPTILANLESLCHTHHRLKHFPDDRTTTGHCRHDQSPERAAVRLRGWKPTMTETHHVAWTSPRGRYYRPETPEPHPPAYPTWLKKHLNQTLNPATTHNPAQKPSGNAETYTAEPDNWPQEPLQYIDDSGHIITDTYIPPEDLSDPPLDWPLPEPPPRTFPEDPEFEAMMWESMTQRGLENPNLGNPNTD